MPLKAQLQLAPAAAEELRTSFARYVAELGTKAPAPAVIEAALRAVVKAHDELEAKQVALVKAEDDLSVAWGMAAKQLAKLRPVFVWGAEQDPSLLEAFPALAGIYAARSVLGQKAASTRAAVDAGKVKLMEARADAAAQRLERAKKREAIATKRAREAHLAVLRVQAVEQVKVQYDAELHATPAGSLTLPGIPAPVVSGKG